MILCLAVVPKLIILTGLILKDFLEQLYKTKFWQMHFCNSMNRFGLMNVLMNSNLHTTEVMLMIYLLLFEKFKNYLNSKHTNIRLTCEKEQNNSMPFLDGLITRT